MNEQKGIDWGDTPFALFASLRFKILIVSEAKALEVLQRTAGASAAVAAPAAVSCR